MTDDEVFDAVREAVVWAKAEVVALTPKEVALTSVLTESPISLDSLEFVAMVTHLEEVVGLEAADEHFFTRSVRTVGDVVAAVNVWIAEAEATSK